MQRTQLAAALVAALGIAIHAPAFAADTEKAVSEKAPVKVAEKTTETKTETTEKGKEGSCSKAKGKEGSCAKKEGKKSHKKETKTTETKEETK